MGADVTLKKIQPFDKKIGMFWKTLAFLLDEDQQHRCLVDRAVMAVNKALAAIKEFKNAKEALTIAEETKKGVQKAKKKLTTVQADHTRYAGTKKSCRSGFERSKKET